MSRFTSFTGGDWYAVCYECGHKKLASSLKRHWQGYYVCVSCWEPRHPQDFVKGVQDIQTPPWTQPMPSDKFVYTCDLNSLSAIPGRAGPGCMIPSRPYLGDPNDLPSGIYT